MNALTIAECREIFDSIAMQERAREHASPAWEARRNANNAKVLSDLRALRAASLRIAPGIRPESATI